MAALAQRFLFLGGTRHGMRLSVMPLPMLRVPVSSPLKSTQNHVFPRTELTEEQYHLQDVQTAPGLSVQVYVCATVDMNDILAKYVAQVLQPQSSDEEKDTSADPPNRIELTLSGRKIAWDVEVAVVTHVAQSLVSAIGPARPA